MVEPERPASGSSSPPARRWSLAVAVGVAGLVAGWVFGSTGASPPITGSSTPTSTTEMAPPTTPTTAGPGSPTTMSETASTEPTVPALGSVDLLPAVADLRGTVALTVPGARGDQSLWVIHPGGRLSQRLDVHMRPGDGRYPLMAVGDQVFFTTAGEGTYRVGVELNERPLQIEKAGILVPDADIGRVWLMEEEDLSWFAPIDAESGDVGGRTEVSADFGWPLGGLGDGLLFTPNDMARYGPVGFWPQGGPPEAVPMELGAGSSIHRVFGHLAVVVSPGSEVHVVDIRTGRRTAPISFDSRAGNVVGVCLSEHGEFLAVVSSMGPVEVFETATGESRGRVSTADPPWTVGWATPSQLVYVGDRDGTASTLYDFDVRAGLSTAIAHLTAPSPWRMATSGAPC